MSATKERPILFKGNMVNAILAGRKTQTRRLVKHDMHPECKYWNKEGHSVKPPYGLRGNRLWVKEHWGYYGLSSCDQEHEIFVKYFADGARREIKFDSWQAMIDAAPNQKLKHPPEFEDLDYHEQLQVEDDLLEKWWKAKRSIPSIFMYRWASRIDLKIRHYRIERLHDITEKDAREEGVMPVNVDSRILAWKDYLYDGDPSAIHSRSSAISSFRSLWISINGIESWESNPWVWVYKFERIK